MAPTSPAAPSTTSYALFSDADALATVEGRLRQLEGEQYGQDMLAAEADAVGDKAAADGHRKQSSDLRKRIGATRATRDALKAKSDAEPAATGDTQT